jgi:hypothetical protein
MYLTYILYIGNAYEVSDWRLAIGSPFGGPFVYVPSKQLNFLPIVA